MNKDRIIEIIENENESSYLDYKEEEYRKEKKIDFLKDIIAMANSHIFDDKYIIYGITNDKVIRGINMTYDVAIFEELVSEYIEPNINIEYSVISHNGVNIGVLRIYDCINKPYMIKKRSGIDKKHIYEGDSWIRKGTRNCKMIRTDLDYIYNQRDILAKRKIEEIKKNVNNANNELMFIQLYRAEDNILKQRGRELEQAICATKEMFANKMEFGRFTDPSQVYTRIMQNITNLVDSKYEHKVEKKQLIDLIFYTPTTHRQKYINAIIELEHNYFILNSQIKKIHNFEFALKEKLSNMEERSDTYNLKGILFDLRIHIEQLTTPCFVIRDNFGNKSENIFDIREGELILELEEMDKNLVNY
ncbi:Divergent AAA domain protein [compost metagenome]